MTIVPEPVADSERDEQGWRQNRADYLKRKPGPKNNSDRNEAVRLQGAIAAYAKAKAPSDDPILSQWTPPSQAR